MDPITHRFINADGYFQSGGSILDANTFAYCGNNPVLNVDPLGTCKVPNYTSAGHTLDILGRLKNQFQVSRVFVMFVRVTDQMLPRIPHTVSLLVLIQHLLQKNKTTTLGIRWQILLELYFVV